MAPRREYDVAEQQEIASAEHPLAGAVMKDRTALVRTPGGQTIPVGFMAEARRNESQTVAGQARDPQYDNALKSIHMRHEATGIQPATILNFLPIPLVVNSTMNGLSNVRIKPAPKAADETDAFSFHIWHEPSIEVAYRGEGINQPVDFLPVQVAKAFVDEYKDFGGVVMFRGLPDEETLAKPEIVRMISEARVKMHAWMLAKIDEANAEWNSPNRVGAKNIVELHRQCALQMKDLGLIDGLPEWVTNPRSLKDVAEKCPNCKTLPNIGALECLECHYILDPTKAYLAGTITEEDGSLERLTRKQVEELGISAYVAETIDEKPERLKRGDPRPPSIAQVRAMQAQMQDDEREPAAL